MARSSHLSELAEKHKLLDRRIAEEQARPAADVIKVNKLKLQKLKLKDEITKLENFPGFPDLHVPAGPGNRLPGNLAAAHDELTAT